MTHPYTQPGLPAALDAAAATGNIPGKGLRVGARLLTSAYSLVLIGTAVAVGGTTWALIAAVLWLAISIGIQLATSATPGQLTLGLCNARVDTGKPGGLRVVGKDLLIGLLSQLTCGIVPVIALVLAEKPLNRTWFDTWTGLVVLRRADARAWAAQTGEPATPPADDAEPGSALGTGLGTGTGTGPRVGSGVDPADATAISPINLATPAHPLATPPALPAPPSAAPAAPEWSTPAPAAPPAGPPPAWALPPEPGTPPAAATPTPPAPAPPPTVPTPVPSAAAEPEAEHIDEPDHTVISPIPLGQAPITTPGRELILSTGVVLTLDRGWSIGRDPRHLPGHEETGLAAVADPGVSRTHLVVRPTNDGAEIIDLHSSNGVSVDHPTGVTTRLSPGEPTRVATGSTLHFGTTSAEVRG